MRTAPVRFLFVVIAMFALLFIVEESNAKRGDSNRKTTMIVTRERDLTDAEYKALEHQLIGATEHRVTAVLGKPTYTPDVRDNGQIRWWYNFGKKGVVTVFLKAGRVVEMGHNEYQTGVREDDFVGPNITNDP